MNIKEKFLELTSRTYPHGTEQDLFHLLPQNLNTDEFGNKYIIIGDNPTTMFTCHLDTASSRVSDVKHRIDNNIIRTDGTSILGADDKAGCVILLNMIENNIKGLYYFFLGEERGCVGSRKVSQKHKGAPITGINKVVSFDRRGTDSIITHQLSSRCCSETFANELARQLNEEITSFNYSTDPTGIYTDSAQFTDVYPECTNISVGYYDEHSHYESQDISHLTLLSQAVLKVRWDELPVHRNTSSYDYEPYDDYEEDEEDYFFSTKSESRTTYFFMDPICGGKSSITLSLNKNKILDVEFTKDRIDYESKQITNLLDTYAIEYDSFDWDGHRLKLVYNPTQESTMYREELSTYIEEFDFWKREISN